MLAVCHTVMVEQDKSGEFKYSASSPDELALVMGSKEVGIVFNQRTSSTISI
jgi:magnesium-transporting ATPase (P-type)